MTSELTQTPLTAKPRSAHSQDRRSIAPPELQSARSIRCSWAYRTTFSTCGILGRTQEPTALTQTSVTMESSQQAPSTHTKGAQRCPKRLHHSPRIRSSSTVQEAGYSQMPRAFHFAAEDEALLVKGTFPRTMFLRSRQVTSFIQASRIEARPSP